MNPLSPDIVGIAERRARRSPVSVVQARRPRVHECGLAGGRAAGAQNECHARFGNTEIFGGSWRTRAELMGRRTPRRRLRTRWAGSS